MELKARKDMDPAFQWDLTPIFPNDAAFDAALRSVTEECERIPAFAGRLGESSEMLLACLRLVDQVSMEAEKAYVYAFLQKSGDGGDPRAQQLAGRAMSVLVKLQTVSSFIQPEILEIPEPVLRDYMDKPEMAAYRFMLENVLRGRSHTLSAAEEEILARLSDAAGTPSNAYDMLTDVELPHSEITDEKGNKVRLTGGTFGNYRESRDRRVREDAFNGWFGDYAKFNNTLAELYAGSVKQDCFGTSVRKFGSCLEGRLFGGNVPVSVYRSLIEAIHDGLPVMRRYLELRRRVMGLENIDMFDLYVPMVAESVSEVTLEDAKRMVRKALRPLGDDYARMLERAFDERWMDVYENKGKAGGAFSIGVYGVHPYVMLNFTNTLDDAFTMAHELGHAMHSWYSDSTQPYATHDYKIMVAEVASTVNEVLLAKYLLATETDPLRKAAILNKLCEGFRTTVFRQTLFAEFELKVHEMYEAGQPLTAETLNALYLELVRTYYEGAEVPEIMQYEWSYIPHFYRAFYVYQYATGYSSAVSIANRILATGDASEYLRFLTTGGSDHPIEELKIAGVDLTRPETVRSALRVFDETVAELERLLLGL